MIDRFRVVPAAYVVFRRRAGLGGQVLLQLRRGTGYMDEHWACAAAGHVESGESVLETACREAFEELGITIDPTDVRPLCAMHRTAEAGWVGQRVDFFFECSRWSGAAARGRQGRRAAVVRPRRIAHSGRAARALRPRDAGRRRSRPNRDVRVLTVT